MNVAAALRWSSRQRNRFERRCCRRARCLQKAARSSEGHTLSRPNAPLELQKTALSRCRATLCFGLASLDLGRSSQRNYLDDRPKDKDDFSFGRAARRRDRADRRKHRSARTRLNRRFMKPNEARYRRWSRFYLLRLSRPHSDAEGGLPKANQSKPRVAVIDHRTSKSLWRSHDYHRQDRETLRRVARPQRDHVPPPPIRRWRLTAPAARPSRWPPPRRRSRPGARPPRRR